MLGAIIGDIVGSRFEFNNHRSKDFILFAKECKITDDTVMTLAIAKAIMKANPKTVHLDLDWEDSISDTIGDFAVQYMQELGRKYPHCSYGANFAKWLRSEDPEPYNSFGNGAAMRVSPVAFFARSDLEARILSDAVTEVTHDHDEGLKGAEAVTVAIFAAKTGEDKKEIRRIIEQDYYALDFTIAQIRDTYQFNETCQETVPQAIVAFLESHSFEDAIRNAISLGGDSDTLAAITGSIAEAYYGIPFSIKEKALTYLDKDLRAIYDDWFAFVGKEYENN